MSEPMLRQRFILGVLAVVIAGCGGDRAEPAAERKATAAPPTEYPVAYVVERDALGALAERPLADAVEGAEVLANSSWDSQHLIVLSEWLHERGIDIDRPREPATADIEKAWDAPVLVITAEHAKRYARRLNRLRPSQAKLRAYFEAFTQESRGDAGRAMAEYLTILRAAMRKAKGDRVVVIPLED